MNLSELYSLGRAELAPMENADSQALWLLTAATGKNRSDLFCHGTEAVSEEEEALYRGYLAQRRAHRPIQQILGSVPFYGLDIKVTEDVLIPRQETELLVELALAMAKPGAHILDLCTGSGCILLSLLKKGRDFTGLGTDLSRQALIVAKENALRNQVENVRFAQGDLFDPVTGTFDLIISNPPYITAADMETLEPEVADYEPHLALYGGEDGLDLYRRIIPAAPHYLNKNGILLFEIGYDQGESVPQLMREAGFSDIIVKKDYSGKDRMVGGKYNV